MTHHTNALPTDEPRDASDEIYTIETPEKRKFILLLLHMGVELEWTGPALTPGWLPCTLKNEQDYLTNPNPPTMHPFDKLKYRRKP